MALDTCEGCKMDLYKSESKITRDTPNTHFWHTECWKIYANTCKALKDNLEGV